MKVPVNVPVFEGNERKYLLDCIETGWISSSGSYITKFEQKMAEFVGQKYGVAVSNGTTALECAVLALNIEKGMEVILPDFTIISCVQAITKAGLVPVMVDCEKDSWNMDVSQIERKITNKTRAIMVVHIYGLSTDMDAVLEIAKKHNLLVIEDVAEAHGLTYKGRQCGSMSDICAFSFFANKHITTGEGGMVLTSNENFYERAKKVRNLFFDEERRYIHEEFGSNFRMTNMQAAIGLAQLENIEKTVIRKRNIGNYYQENLKKLKNLQLPLEKYEGCENIYWIFGLVSKKSNLDADYYMQKLKEQGVETRHFFYPIHKQPALIKEGCCSKEQLDDSLFPNSNYISKHGFYIPSGLGLTQEQQEYVVEVLQQIDDEA